MVDTNSKCFVDNTVSMGKNVQLGHYVTIHEHVKIGKNSKIEDGVIIYEDCEIGKNCIVGAGAILKPQTIIGDYSIFGTLSITEGDVKIGRYTTIHAQCHITKGVSIGNNVFIGPKLVTMNTPDITAGEHGTSPNKKIPKMFPLKIEDNVRIGTNVTIAPNITISHDSFIAVGSLVTKNIPPFSKVKSSSVIVGKIIGTIQDK